MSGGVIQYQNVVDAEGNVVGRIPLQFGETEDGDNRPVMPLPPPDKGQPIRSGLKARSLDSTDGPGFYLWFLFHLIGPIIVAIGVVVIVVCLLRIGGLM